MATDTLTAAQLDALTPAEIITQLDALPDLDLYHLPDSLVLTLPDEVLTWRRDKLLASRKGLSAGQAWQVIGISRNHFMRMRSNFLATGAEGFDAVPEPDYELSDDDVRRPGDGRTGRGGAARWTLGVIIRWLIERERVDEKRRGSLTLVLRPGGRKPPGRVPMAAAAA